MSRLPVQPGERIDRSEAFDFSFAGHTVTAHPGDTIASAAYAGGRRTFSRGFKYHRPRGLLCCAGQCPNCLVTVDGRPDVRACVEPARAGLQVTHQNAWPSLERDALRVVDVAGSRLTPPGFYYKTFKWPRRMWPLYERLLRNVAGLGRVGAPQAERAWRTDYRRRHADVLVIGGGAAGLRAAQRAAELGADVVLVDDGAAPGGRLLEEGRGGRAATAAAGARAAGVELLADASALGWFDGLVPVWQGSTLHQVRARQVVAATGGIEQPLVFERNDLPGIMLSGAVLRLIRLFGVRPGRRAVIATVDDRGLEAALALAGAGVEVAAVADARPRVDPALTARLNEAGLELLAATGVRCAAGRTLLREVVLAGPSGERRVRCDLLAVCGGFVPAGSLLAQAGAGAQAIRAAGEVAGHGVPEAVELSGLVAGAQAADALGLADEPTRRRLVGEGERLKVAALVEGVPPGLASEPTPAGTTPRGRAFVCLCEDVTEKDIAYAAAEGYDSAELCKRYTTVTMGPCQGRMCRLSAIRAIGRATGRAPEEVGGTTARPPWTPTPLGVLAGRPLQPAKRSSLHEGHRALEASIAWAGDWRRAYDYGDPVGEVRAVHECAGIIDVSSLGKLLVRGPQAGALLDRLYPNRMSSLRPGRVRYGALLSDAGRIIDDGTVCRLSDQDFLVTTTSSGAGSVEEWIAWWQADWRLAAVVTDVTQALAAINLAGPRAREVLSVLTENDCSSDALAYLDGREMRIAGAHCLVLRIGFVGEPGYEIHCPAAHGPHLWDRLLESGRAAGLRPFGLEAQRVLRLEKQHVIVAQDTDSESTPYGAGMGWAVKKDKPDAFLGRWALERDGAEEPALRLVGIRLHDGVVPREGAAVLQTGRPAGRVTSARFSERLGQVIGLAWVPAALAHDGATVAVVSDDRHLDAEVATAPFYDPEGARLRA